VPGRSRARAGSRRPMLSAIQADLHRFIRPEMRASTALAMNETAMAVGRRRNMDGEERVAASQPQAHPARLRPGYTMPAAAPPLMPGVCARRPGSRSSPKCVITFGHRAASTPMRVIPAYQAGLSPGERERTSIISARARAFRGRGLLSRSRSPGISRLVLAVTKFISDPRPRAHPLCSALYHQT